MSNRDMATGKFVSKDKSMSIEVPMPTYTTLCFWIVTIIVLLPWIAIIVRSGIAGEIITAFDKLLTGNLPLNPTPTQTTTGTNGKDGGW